MTQDVVGTSTVKTLLGSHPILEWYVVLQLSTTKCRYLCHWGRYSPEAIFKRILSEACVLSSLPIVCGGCFVVAHISVMPKIWVISAMMVDVKAEALSVMRVVGKYECFVIMSIIILATLVAVASISRQKSILKKHQELSLLSGIRHWSVGFVINPFAWHPQDRGPIRAILAIQV